jgi:FAD/FMN-containing dehydrogenase
LPYGFGRSYGDSCLNEGRTLIDCSRLSRFLAFDQETGLLSCESGVSLAEILKFAVPRGWFLPVTPGTKFVTVGGAIANDVHGKNHHGAGSFGLHVTRFLLCRSDCELLECSADRNSELFRATIGGLGLTGVVLAAEIQLKPIQGDRIDSEGIPFQSIPEFEAISEESDEKFEYTVAWIDCLSGRRSRGMFFRGNHSEGFHNRREIRFGPKVPCALPGFLWNERILAILNSSYYRWKSLRRSRALVPYDAFFYPLDAIRQWNLLYGKAGFVQYQCVVPEGSLSALEEMLDRVARAKLGSFLTVLKRFGSRLSPGMLSFPRPGFTLTLDFPVNGEGALELLSTLDQIVLQAGGALYPAKDARMSLLLFEASFQNWRAFRDYVDPAMSSSFWRRVTQG